MVRIVTKYGDLDLPENLPLEFVMTHPAFSQDFIDGSYSQGATLPFTKQNQKFFQFAESLEIRHRIKTYDGLTVCFKNLKLFYGKLNLIKTTNDGYLISFSVTGFALDLFQKKIRTLFLGQTYFLGQYQEDVLAAAKAIVYQNYPAVDYNFPTVENISFYGATDDNPTTGTNAEYLGKINNYSGLLDEFIINSSTSGVVNNYNTLVPMFYAFFLMKKSIELIGYKWTGNLFNHQELSQLVIYNGQSLDEIRPTEAMKVQQPGTVNYNIIAGQALQFSNEAAPFSDQFGMWDPVTYTFTALADGEYTIEQKLKVGSSFTSFGGIIFECWVNGYSYSAFYDAATPGFSAGDIFNFIHTIPLNAGDTFRIYFEAVTAGENIDLVDCELTVFNQNNTYGVNRHKKEFNVSDHLPDWNVSDFLKEICSIPGVYLTFNPLKKEVSFNFRSDLFKGPIKQLPHSMILDNKEITISKRGWKFTYDWSTDPLAQNNFLSLAGYSVIASGNNYRQASAPTALNQLFYETTTDRYYRSKWNPEPDNFYSWEPYSHSKQEIVVGDGSVAIAPKFSPALMVKPKNFLPGIPTPPDYNGDVIMPKIEHQGNSDAYDQRGNDWPNKIMFYRTVYTFAGFISGSFPFATSLQIDPDGTENYGTSLLYSSPKGPYELFWKKFCEAVISGDDIQLDLDLSLPEFASISHEQRLYIHKFLFWYSTLKLSIGQNGIEKARAELIQIKA